MTFPNDLLRHYYTSKMPGCTPGVPRPLESLCRYYALPMTITMPRNANPGATPLGTIPYLCLLLCLYVGRFWPPYTPPCHAPSHYAIPMAALWLLLCLFQEGFCPPSPCPAPLHSWLCPWGYPSGLAQATVAVPIATVLFVSLDIAG